MIDRLFVVLHRLLESFEIEVIDDVVGVDHAEIFIASLEKEAYLFDYRRIISSFPPQLERIRSGSYSCWM